MINHLGLGQSEAEQNLPRTNFCRKKILSKRNPERNHSPTPMRAKGNVFFHSDGIRSRAIIYRTVSSATERNFLVLRADLQPFNPAGRHVKQKIIGVTKY